MWVHANAAFVAVVYVCLGGVFFPSSSFGKNKAFVVCTI